MASDERPDPIFVLRSPISGQVYGAANDPDHLTATSGLELVEMVAVEDVRAAIATVRANARGHDPMDAVLDAVLSTLGLDSDDRPMAEERKDG